MRHETKRMLVTAATLCAAGCAKSDFQVVGSQNRSNMRPVLNSAMANATEEKPPKILPETHFAAGLLFERQGQYDKAILQYRKAVALNHNYVVAFHRLGLLQSATDQHLESAQTLKKAVALRPDDAVLHNDLGFECMRIEQWDEAERELRRAIDLQPDLATAYINLAMVLAKSERFGESLASFQVVLPEPDAYYNLGLMYRGQQRYLEAVETFRHVLKIAPEFSAAKVQLEQLAARIPPTAHGRIDVKSPIVATKTLSPTELLALLDDFTTPEPAPPQTAPEQSEQELAVESNQAWGTTVADLAAILAVLDADGRINDERPINRPELEVEAASATADEGFAEERSLDDRTPASNQVLADAPCVEEMMMPSIVVPAEDAVAVAEEMKDDEPVAVEFVDGPLFVAATPEEAGPSVPCDDLQFEEADADDVLAALPTAPTTLPTGFAESWIMLEELEAKVVLLKYETQVARAEKTGFGDWSLGHDVLTNLTDWIQKGDLISNAELGAAAADDEESDDLDVPFVEIDEEDTTDETSVPTPSKAIDEGPRKEPAPSDRTSLWTTQFGELDTLFAIVRNETICWEELDAQKREVLALGDVNGPCGEGIEQAASIGSDEFTPVMPIEDDASMDAVEYDPSTNWESNRSGDVYSYPRGLESLPD